MRIVFNITPKAHQSVRSANGSFYQPAPVKAYRRAVALIAKQSWKAEPTDKAIFITKLIYKFKVPKKLEKQLNVSIDNGMYFYKTTRPDLGDNLNKAFFDALTGVIWQDDSQIVSIDGMKKVWGSSDGIYLEFEVRGL